MGKQWSNKDVFRDAAKYEQEKRRARGEQAPSKPTNGEKVARELLDPAKLPMKPPGVRS